MTAGNTVADLAVSKHVFYLVRHANIKLLTFELTVYTNM